MQNLYTRQEAMVQMENSEAEWFQITKGCILFYSIDLICMLSIY